jgi:hypothetical protein
MGLVYLVRFGFRMWEIFDLKVISAAENSSKLKKIRFWKEKSIENVVHTTWANGTGHTSK